MGMPGPFPWKVVEVKSPSAILRNHVNSSVIQRMVALGMTELTGASTVLKAWQALFSNQDIVGIKMPREFQAVFPLRRLSTKSFKG
jgi:hypothetical protein